MQRALGVAAVELPSLAAVSAVVRVLLTVVLAVLAVLILREVYGAVRARETNRGAESSGEECPDCGAAMEDAGRRCGRCGSVLTTNHDDNR